MRSGFLARFNRIAPNQHRQEVPVPEIAAAIGIMLVTAAIVLPVLLNARERDRQATCISNLGQIGLAFMEYAEDNDQTLFNPYYFEYYKGDRDCGYTADSTLEPYIKNHAAHDVNCVWVCPDVTKFGFPQPGSQVGFGAFYCTYTMNVFLNAPEPSRRPFARSAVPEPDVCYSDILDQSNPFKRWNRDSMREDKMARSEPRYLWKGPTNERLVPTRLGARLSSVISPAQTDLLFEGVVEDYAAEGVETGYVGRAPREGDYIVDQGFYADNQEAASKWGYVLQPSAQPRHVRFNNYLFCDGHVKALAPKRFPYDIRHDPENIWFARIGRSGRPIPAPGGPGC